MPTQTDTKARALALRLLEKFGAPSTYIHRSGTDAYDPDTSTMVPTETTSTPKVYIGAPTKADLRAGVKETEMTCLIAGSAIAFEPSPMDTLTFAGKSYRVRPVTPVYSGEQVALWILGVTQ